MKSRGEIKRAAKASLRGRRGFSIALILVPALIMLALCGASAFFLFRAGMVVDPGATAGQLHDIASDFGSAAMELTVELAAGITVEPDDAADIEAAAGEFARDADSQMGEWVADLTGQVEGYMDSLNAAARNPDLISAVHVASNIMPFLLLAGVWLLLALVLGQAFHDLRAAGYTGIYRGVRCTMGGLLRDLLPRIHKKIAVALLVAAHTALWTLLCCILQPVVCHIVWRFVQSEFLWNVLMGLIYVLLLLKLTGYVFAPYLLAEHRHLSARDCVRLSQNMAKGHRTSLVLMELTFLGWFLLSALTAMVLGVVYVLPYFETTLAGYYTELRGQAIADGKLFADELGESSHTA